VKLNERQAEAFVRLQNNQDFKEILEAMEAYGAECVEHALYGPEENVHTFRGMARGVAEVMRALSGSQEFLIKTRSRK